MTAHGKSRKRRPGCHKHRNSPETGVWNSQFLIPPRPSWMTPTTYTLLAELRAKL